MRTECLDCNKSLEGCKCIEDTIEFTEADIEVFIDGIENPAEPNQALKDAAERYIAGDNYNRYYDDFIEGAKWQQKKSRQNLLMSDEIGQFQFSKPKMYSEEDMIAFGEFIFKHTLLTHTKGVKSLFEQFKNK